MRTGRRHFEEERDVIGVLLALAARVQTQLPTRLGKICVSGKKQNFSE